MVPSQSTATANPPPEAKRAVTFFDGQNLFHAAKEAFGYNDANYDPVALSKRPCATCNCQFQQARFYTGVPGHQENPRGYQFWTAKLQGMRNAGVQVFQRPLRYRNKTVRLPLTSAAPKDSRLCLPDGTFLTRGEKLYLANGKELPADTELTVRIGEEKGIDVRIALDLIGLALKQEFDVAILFTQDQDLAEAVKEVGLIAKRQNRTVTLYSAYPDGANNGRGVDGTTWIKIDHATYSACLDQRNYYQGQRRRH